MKDKHEFRIVITPFCNYRCFFCHSEGLTEECTPMLLSPKDYRFAVSVAQDLWGWDTVTITGGEPLVSPIYRETCKEIAKTGVKITTVTNASLVASPRKILKHNDQLNISLHTLDPEAYKKITRTSYPLSQVINTIISIRAQLPELKIHLNNTVVRGINDTEKDFQQMLEFAQNIGASAKFIDLASTNPNYIVPVEEIATILEQLGYTQADQNTWQIIMQKGDKQVVLTRCGFGDHYSGWGPRNLFLNPDGVISADSCGGLNMSVLREIHEQDTKGFAQKVGWFFPPAKRI